MRGKRRGAPSDGLRGAIFFFRFCLRSGRPRDPAGQDRRPARVREPRPSIFEKATDRRCSKLFTTRRLRGQWPAEPAAETKAGMQRPRPPMAKLCQGGVFRSAAETTPNYRFLRFASGCTRRCPLQPSSTEHLGTQQSSTTDHFHVLPPPEGWMGGTGRHGRVAQAQGSSPCFLGNFPTLTLLAPSVPRTTSTPGPPPSWRSGTWVSGWSGL